MTSARDAPDLVGAGVLALAAQARDADLRSACPPRLLGAHDRRARVRPRVEQARVPGAARHRVVAGALRGVARAAQIFGTVTLAWTISIFAPSFVMPRRSYSRPTMNPVTLCMNSSGMPSRSHSCMNVAALLAASRVDHAVVAEDPDLEAPDEGPAGDHRVAVAGLELVEQAAVDDARDHLAHLELLLDVVRDDPVELVGVVERRLGLAAVAVGLLAPRPDADDVARERAAPRPRCRRRSRPCRRPTCACRRRRARRRSRPRRWRP